ncbi:MAG TPA: NUDIX hydrolase [Candidatus Bathyarchaeia archaeon]|nr:NUDIX hydrolase [Candidatus Bathyarchaeia archaeon]
MGQVESGIDRGPDFSKEVLTPIGAAGILVVRQGPGETRFLLGQRLGPLEHLRYSPPGGRFEPEEAEDPRKCAVRELVDETGIDASPEELIQVYEGRQVFTESRAVFLYFGYILIWQDRMGEPQNREPDIHRDWQWLSRRQIQELREADLAAAAVELLNAYDKFEINQLSKAALPERLPLRHDVIVPRLFTGTDDTSRNDLGLSTTMKDLEERISRRRP